MTSGKDKSTLTKNVKFGRAQARGFQESRKSDFLQLRLGFSEPMAAEENGSKDVELKLRSLINRLGRVDGMRSSREKSRLIALL